jgi:hypothetical protein
VFASFARASLNTECRVGRYEAKWVGRQGRGLAFSWTVTFAASEKRSKTSINTLSSVIEYTDRINHFNFYYSNWLRVNGSLLISVTPPRFLQDFPAALPPTYLRLCRPGVPLTRDTRPGWRLARKPRCFWWNRAVVSTVRVFVPKGPDCLPHGPSDPRWRVTRLSGGWQDPLPRSCRPHRAVPST